MKHFRILWMAAPVAAGLFGCARHEPTSHPPPTENWLGEDAEEKQKERRKAWFEERHKAPPEVDWREIERANGLTQIEKRNRLAESAIQIASPWVERGSDNQAGRAHAASLSSDRNWLYVGSSLGGLWKGKPDGAAWKPLGDNLYGGAHWLAAVPGENPGDPDVLLAATDGGLVHVTRDEGLTWEVPAGLGTVAGVRRVLVTSDVSRSVFLVKRNSGGGYRLMRSQDRMASFEQVYSFVNYDGDVWARRDGSPDLYLVTGASVFRSLDLGTTWTAVGATPAGSSRGELVGSEAGAPRLWTVFQIGSQRQLHRSDDAGASWSFVTTISDYWESLNASIVDADLFAYGGVEVWRTADGGTSFAKVNSWTAYYNNPATKLHADIPGIDVVPDSVSGEIWYVSTDGGLFRSFDGLQTVQNLSLSGLRISQYYSTLTSSADPNHVAAGSQDQGYQRAGAAPAPTGTAASFNQLISGDYGHLTSGDGDHDFVFSTYPGFILIHMGETSPNLLTANFPSGESYAWMPPVVADPLDPRDFFFCAAHLYRYGKVSNNWISVQWSSFNFASRGGEYVSALAFSPLDQLRAFAVTNDGDLFYSIDQGVTWTESASNGPGGQYFYGTALLASSLDVNTAWVGGSGYGASVSIYRTVDGGATWQPFDEGLPDTLVYCLGEAPDGSGTLFCGTETAAYRRDAGAASWVDVTGNQAPVTVYWSVEAHPAENTLRFGTYGRGIWDYQIDPQARSVIRNGSGINRLCLSEITPAELGATWSVQVDATNHPGATAATLVIYEAPIPGTLLRYGELLVDLSSVKLLTSTLPASGGSSTIFSFPVPNDPSFAGFQAYCQAAVAGGGVELCNALDIVVGY